MKAGNAARLQRAESDLPENPGCNRRKPSVSSFRRHARLSESFSRTSTPSCNIMTGRNGAPGEACASGETGRIMHGCLDLGGGHLMASDVPSGTPLPDAPHAFLNLAVDSVEAADRIFAALSDGGTVRVPMAPSFFAERFGMLVDRFGTGWMVLHTRGCRDAGAPEHTP